MTERAAFIRRICEEPDEDTHRLVFADWLEENGEPERANAIRWMVSRPSWFADDTCLEHSDHSPGYLAACDWLKGGADSLLNRDFGGVWHTTQGMWIWHKGQLVSQDFCATLSRGFVSHIELSTQAFLDHAEALFGTHPVTSVRLTDRTPWLWSDEACWYRENGPESGAPGATDVPSDLFRELSSYLTSSDCGSPNDLRWFASPELAHKALSAACVALGRKLAGLPPLPAPQPQH